MFDRTIFVVRQSNRGKDWFVFRDGDDAKPVAEILQ
jgi:hypothetical protein